MVQNENNIIRQLESLSGYEVNQRLSLFINSLLVFNANTRVLKNWYMKFNQPEAALYLWSDCGALDQNKASLEMQRNFSNFLMSAFALRDHWYSLYNEFYKETPVDEKVKALCTRNFSKNGFASFMQNFRNYVTHKGYPLVSRQLSISKGILSNDILFDKSELLKFDGWNADAKKYILSLDKSVKLICLVNDYSNLLNRHYSELIGILKDYHKSELLELKEFAQRNCINLRTIKL